LMLSQDIIKELLEHAKVTTYRFARTGKVTDRCNGWYYIRKINSRKRQKRGPSIYDPRQP